MQQHCPVREGERLPRNGISAEQIDGSVDPIGCLVAPLQMLDGRCLEIGGELVDGVSLCCDPFAIRVGERLIADRRNADVVALGYCQLLSLAARDLNRLFATEPTLREQIEAVAQARTATAESG